MRPRYTAVKAAKPAGVERRDDARVCCVCGDKILASNVGAPVMFYTAHTKAGVVSSAWHMVGQCKTQGFGLLAVLGV